MYRLASSVTFMMGKRVGLLDGKVHEGQIILKRRSRLFKACLY